MDKELKKILYVEDEADIREIAKISLEELGGFTVKYCSSGKEALDVAESFAPDLFLLDVMMPVLDGPATLKELRKIDSLKDVPAIFMTAKVQGSEIEQYKKIGAIEIISKPFDPMILADLIKSSWKNIK